MLVYFGGYVAFFRRAWPGEDGVSTVSAQKTMHFQYRMSGSMCPQAFGYVCAFSTTTFRGAAGFSCCLGCGGRPYQSSAGLQLGFGPASTQAMGTECDGRDVIGAEGGPIVLGLAAWRAKHLTSSPVAASVQPDLRAKRAGGAALSAVLRSHGGVAWVPGSRLHRLLHR